jgi:hypothetical protein
MANRVELDTRKLDADARRLNDRLRDGAREGARAQAERTARQIAGRVPRRTGHLASTVATVADGDGYAVTYGEGVPYAAYIEKRSHAVESGVESADTQFADAMAELAAREVRRL